MLPSRHLERHALQHEDHVVVDDLDVVDREVRLRVAVGAAALHAVMRRRRPLPRTRRGAAERARRCSVPTPIPCAQSRGVMFFSFAYFAADSSTIWRTSSLSGVIQSVIDLPLLAVPLLELHRAAAFVVGAGHLERLHEAGRAELLQPRFGQIAGSRGPSASARRSSASLPYFSCALRIASTVRMPCTTPRVVIDAADARLVFQLPLPLRVDVLLDVLDHREVGARRR